MALEIGGALRRVVVLWILVWPSLGLAEPPQQDETAEPFAEASTLLAGPQRARLAPLSLGRLTVSKRGLEYRSAFAFKRRQIPFRVWGGRKSKQPALGIDFEPKLRGGRLRAGAYASGEEVGFAIRFRY